MFTLAKQFSSCSPTGKKVCLTWWMDFVYTAFADCPVPLSKMVEYDTRIALHRGWTSTVWSLLLMLAYLHSCSRLSYELQCLINGSHPHLLSFAVMRIDRLCWATSIVNSDIMSNRKKPRSISSKRTRKKETQCLVTLAQQSQLEPTHTGDQTGLGNSKPHGQYWSKETSLFFFSICSNVHLRVMQIGNQMSGRFTKSPLKTTQMARCWRSKPGFFLPNKNNERCRHGSTELYCPVIVATKPLFVRLEPGTRHRWTLQDAG